MQRCEPGWTGWLDRIAKIRDAALVGSGAIYVTGYLARALHSLEHNLGIPPGVQFEYFVAGLLMLAPAAVLVSGLWGLVLGLRKVGAWIMADRARTSAMKFVLPGAIAFGFVLAAVANAVDSRVLNGLAAVVMLSILLLGAAFGIGHKAYVMADDPKSGPSSQAARKGWMLTHKVGQLFMWFIATYGVIFLLAVVAALLVAGSVLLRYVPQELGGGKPKCAYLDLSEGRLSSEVRAILVDSGARAQGASVVRSKALEIYSSSDPWLVKLPNQAHNMTYRVDKETVRAITWCQ